MVMLIHNPSVSRKDLLGETKIRPNLAKLCPKVVLKHRLYRLGRHNVREKELWVDGVVVVCDHEVALCDRPNDSEKELDVVSVILPPSKLEFGGILHRLLGVESCADLLYKDT